VPHLGVCLSPKILLFRLIDNIPFSKIDKTIYICYTAYRSKVHSLKRSAAMKLSLDDLPPLEASAIKGVLCGTAIGVIIPFVVLVLLSN
tara:strand:+ start:6224 stop:6490 length:267 start_codon:yes stop_codon:yes gene_type:complete